MVEAREFSVATDHKPLTFALSTNRDNCSPRQFRYLDYISQFTTDIRYIKGEQNVVADTLSRIEELTATLNYHSLAKEQEDDAELHGLLSNRFSLKECETCQRSKVTQHSSAPLLTFALLSSRFRHIHMDIVGPIALSCNYRYCLTIVDRATRRPEAYPLQDITAETCISALISGWIARFGCPEHITIDRGRQFDSQLFKNLAALVGATHHLITASPCC
ncbi:uncharacterized protein LOC124542510 [Vanessa cardui]|uniref:uncharacterized protein LOC124542510 n=1 Tax=Vanessa cardui TaxID=171605 RepID=UPI001F143204|nr:uncharacterized protein LOC124542510 [Vanessa cardui]